jgi:hypothetical protein
LRERLRGLATRCSQGVVADCLILRRLCEQHEDLCPVEDPPRPAVAPTPRPLPAIAATATPTVQVREPTRDAPPVRPSPTKSPEAPKPTATPTRRLEREATPVPTVSIRPRDVAR